MRAVPCWSYGAVLNQTNEALHPEGTGDGLKHNSLLHPIEQDHIGQTKVRLFMSRHNKKRAFQGDIPAVTSQEETRSNVTSLPSTSHETIPHFSTPRPAEHIIRQRAYELYEKRGHGDGHAEEDWLHAEAEVLGTVFRRARLG